MSGDATPWLDDVEPHDPEQSRVQLAALLHLLAPAPKRILDLGCGAGRALIPLAAAGHDLVGLDQSESALAAVRAALLEAGLSAELVHADFLAGPETLPAGPFDFVLCLGNTFMTVADVDRAVELLRGSAGVLAADGRFVLDDCPGDFWPELTEANWQSGLSPDGDVQIVWSESDAVFAIRQGSAIDTESWNVRAGDRTQRLWSDGALRLAARLAGLSGPHRHDDAGLLTLRHMET